MIEDAFPKLGSDNTTLSPTAPPFLPKLCATNANINEVYSFLPKNRFTVESTYRDDRRSLPKTGQ